MLVLIGPSASGKTESAKIMINRYPISRVVTCTTRPKRINEIDGFDYHFYSLEEFKNLEKQGYFIETAVYNGFWYGTPKNELGDDKFIILEPQGLESFLALKPCLIVAIFLNTDESVRMSRMKERKDKTKDIEKRIEADRIEFNLNHIKGLDLVIDTTDITLSNLADLVYSKYIELLKQKQENDNGSTC
ncbi:MAG: hypothetical protein JXB08_04360 [Bacilli bacterium]|nr:hypothetical protein [Bacilli bacterium]MBN2876373.1 hypothetical protein [Bacilli bacterium]